MAFSKNILAYPSAYVELFEAGLRAPGQFKIPCVSFKQASKARMTFYGIKGAILHTKDHPLRELCPTKEIIINSKTNEVIFRDHNDSPRQQEGLELLALARSVNHTNEE